MPDLRSRSTQIGLLVIIVLTMVLGVFLRQQREAAYARRLSLEKALGAVPLFVEAPRVVLYDSSDRGVPLEDYRGRFVFVNFWATWCSPCIAEMPSLIALEASLDPADIAFVSIAEDDSWPPLNAYLRKNPLPFDIFRDRPPRVEKDFETGSYPMSFWIDREGQALYRFKGARNWDTAEVRELLAMEGIGAR